MKTIKEEDIKKLNDLYREIEIEKAKRLEVIFEKEMKKK